MKTFILFVVALFLISCKGQKIERGALYGSFYNDKKYSKDYQLILRPDSIFYWSGIYKEVGSCMGKWRIEDDKFLILRSYDLDPFMEAILNGPRGPKEYRFQIMDANRLKLKNITYDFGASKFRVKDADRLKFKNITYESGTSKLQVKDTYQLEFIYMPYKFGVSKKTLSKFKYKNLVLERKIGGDTLKFNCGPEYFEF